MREKSAAANPVRAWGGADCQFVAIERLDDFGGKKRLQLLLQVVGG